MNEIIYKENIVKRHLEGLGFGVTRFNDGGGYPDFLVGSNGLLFNKISFWVEVKTPHDGLSENQMDRISRLKECVYVFFVREDESIQQYRIKVTKTEIIPLKVRISNKKEGD